MKKLFISALLALTVAGSAFAKDANNINFRILSSFQAEFKKATNVSWTVTGEFSKATFQLNNERTEAFYKADGDLVGTSKSICLDELPVSAKRTFAKKYADYTVKEAIRFDGTENGAYYISAGNENKSVIIKVDDDGLLSIYKETKK